MSKPLTHTFGSAKYVYASAYDQLEADNDRVTKYSIAMSENMAELQDRLSDAEFNLETSRQYAIGMSKTSRNLRPTTPRCGATRQGRPTHQATLQQFSK